MKLEIRKVLTVIEEVFIEGGKAGPRPITAIAVAVATQGAGVGALGAIGV